MGPLIDFLLPASDPAVFVQLGVVLVGRTAAVWCLRHRSEWRVLALGVVLLLLGLMGLRALH